MSGVGRASVETRNPATGKVIAEYAVDDAGRVELLVAKSRVAFLAWRKMPIERRAEVLATFSTTLEAKTESLWLN